MYVVSLKVTALILAWWRKSMIGYTLVGSKWFKLLVKTHLTPHRVIVKLLISSSLQLLNHVCSWNQSNLTFYRHVLLVNDLKWLEISTESLSATQFLFLGLFFALVSCTLYCIENKNEVPEKQRTHEILISTNSTFNISH